MRKTAAYQANNSKSVKQLSLNIALYSALYLLALVSFGTSYLLFGLSIGLITFLLIRIFVIQHDCTHYAYWKTQKANNLTGTLLAGLTHVPHIYWSKTHRQHHGTSGNLEKREYGDIWMLTVDEYAELSGLEKVRYRLYRSPFVLMFIGGAYLFFVRFKNPFAPSAQAHKAQTSMLVTNALLLLRIGLLCVFFPWKVVLLIEALAIYLGSAIAIFLFYLQHNYEETYWKNSDTWDYEAAALEGSSFLNMGKIFHWLTSDIGYHHIHHLDPKVPNYLLSKVHEEVNFDENVIYIGFKEIVPAFNMKLWDEKKQAMVGF